MDSVSRYLSNESGGSGGRWSIVFVFCSVLLVVLLWVIPATLRSCRRCWQSEPRREDIQQEAFERAFERMLFATEADFVRAILQNGPDPIDRAESRKIYIERVLMKKKFKEYRMGGPKAAFQDKNEKLDGQTEDAKEEDEDVEAAGHTSSSPEHEDTCAICLCKYEDDDEVAWSLNKQCNHVFHRDCIGEWLQKKEECPFCRRFFLHFESNNPNVANRSANNASASRSSVPHVAPPGATDGDDAGGMDAAQGSVMDVFREMGRVYRMMQLAEREGGDPNAALRAASHRDLIAQSAGEQNSEDNDNPRSRDDDPDTLDEDDQVLEMVLQESLQEERERQRQQSAAGNQE